jgi:RHS repeat-associated protein
VVTGSGPTYTHAFFRTNHQGSVIAMSADDGSRAEGPFIYDPYGNCFDGANPCSAGEPYRFTGRRLDPETGLLYYRARYYDPAKGRFLQTDPVGYTADLNLYTYAENDPVDGEDPMGLTPAQAADWASRQVDYTSFWGDLGTHYSKWDTNTQVTGKWSGGGTWLNGRFANKCNIFVYDALVAGQARPGLVSGHIPTAEEWFDTQVHIANYRVLGPDEKLTKGDVISDQHHVGIVAESAGKSVSAASAHDPIGDTSPQGGLFGAIVSNDWGFRKTPKGKPEDKIVARRHVDPSSTPSTLQTPSFRICAIAGISCGAGGGVDIWGGG